MLRPARCHTRGAVTHPIHQIRIPAASVILGLEQMLSADTRPLHRMYLGTDWPAEPSLQLWRLFKLVEEGPTCRTNSLLIMHDQKSTSINSSTT
ncbi:hypothetical protein E2C01_002007 [Portunus trituberculatus]|uniref:Uncharacterized protein n=1 Tax=Portunus trituberculatus TaxID=210409 RepID=A0A5B7CLW6_PORTR|nr:hypothetical protein [Portunus trituberculatus]